MDSLVSLTAFFALNHRQSQSKEKARKPFAAAAEDHTDLKKIIMTQKFD
jgi:hypothetical protein